MFVIVRFIVCAKPSGSEEERQVFEKAQHHSKLQQKGLEPGLLLKVSVMCLTLIRTFPEEMSLVLYGTFSEV